MKVSNIHTLLYILLIIFFCSSCELLKVSNSSSNTSNQSSSTKQNPVFIDNISTTLGTVREKTTATASSKKTKPSKRPAQKQILILDDTLNRIETTGVITVKQTPDSAQSGDDYLRMKYSTLLNVLAIELPSVRLLRNVEEWYGTPYCMGGSGASKRCIDCSGFTSTVIRNTYGVIIPRIAKDQYKETQRVDKSDLQEGDLVFFHTTRSGISHVGLYLANGKFVHASTSGGVMVSDLNEAYWIKSFRGGGRITKS